MKPEQQDSFLKLLSALATSFAEENRQGAQMAAEALCNADINTYRRMPSNADPSEVLAATRALTDSLPVSELVRRCEPLLDWTSWEGEGLPNDVSKRLFTTELLGPDGHIPADHVRVGLLASDAWTDYPVSSHSGEETYFVIAGVAEWIVGSSGYKKRSPGELIHHPAWEPHGRKTVNEPFLGAWRWSGDLDLSTFSIK